MAETVVQDSQILYDIAMAVITQLDEKTGLVASAVPKIVMNSSEKDMMEADLSPVVSKGNEKILRSKKKILADVQEDDLLYGYNLKFKNVVLNLQAAALFEGGKIRYSTETGHENEIVGYDMPMLSEGMTTKPFMMELYIANYEGNSIMGYNKITMNWCKGTPMKMSFKKDFFTPEFDIECRENTLAKKTVKAVDLVKELPIIV